MRISHNKDKRPTQYNISGTKLRNVSNYKDLGVIMASTTAKSVFEALASAKIDASEIACLQRKMNGEVIVTFESILAKEKFLRLNSLQVDPEHFALQDVNKPLSFLTTYDAPFELSDLDIICLQEVHCSSVQECSSWFLSSRFGVVCTPGSVRSSGCAILFRPSLSLSGSWYDTEGHYLQCEFSFRDQSFRVCCLYVPNPNPAQDHFLDNLQAKIYHSVPSLFCGDFKSDSSPLVQASGNLTLPSLKTWSMSVWSWTSGRPGVVP